MNDSELQVLLTDLCWELKVCRASQDHSRELDLRGLQVEIPTLVKGPVSVVSIDFRDYEPWCALGKYPCIREACNMCRESI